MHPDDVREYVEEQVAELRARVEAAPELRVSSIELDGVQLRVVFEKDERPKLQHSIGSQLVAPGGQGIVFQYEVPDLSRRVQRALILALDCTDVDGQPPTAELLLPDGAPLPPAQWPTDLSRQGIVHGHPDYPRPFFCRRGLREYHSHPQHEDDPWDCHREGLPLYTLVLELLHDLQTRWILQ